MVMKKISKSLNQLKMIVAQTFAADNSTDDTSKDTKIERSLKRKKLMIPKRINFTSFSNSNLSCEKYIPLSIDE